MRPAAHSLSLPPPKKVSKERRPHVSDPALHCAALRCVPGKPARARACPPPVRERQTQRFGMGCKALSRGKAVALQGCASRKSAQSAFLQPRMGGGQAHSAAARQNSFCDLRSRRSDDCRESAHDASTCCAVLARRRHRPRRRCLKGWASRAIAALGPQWVLLRSPLPVGRLGCMGLALRGETVGMHGATNHVPHAASVQGRECVWRTAGGGHAPAGMRAGCEMPRGRTACSTAVGEVEWAAGAKDGEQKWLSSQAPAQRLL